MITSDNFVWLHFPKCAGTRIESIFRKYYSEFDEISQDPVGLDINPSISWHDSIHRRERRDPSFSIGNRTIICSFRRLPSWLISRYNFEVNRSPHLEHHAEWLLEGKFITQEGLVRHADSCVEKYLPKKIQDANKVIFIRVEYFKEDFINAFSNFIDISVIPEEEYNFKENASVNIIHRSILDMLVDKIDQLYEKCPRWRNIEQLAYNDKHFPNYKNPVF